MPITMPVAGKITRQITSKIIKETAPNIMQDNINNILPPEKLTEPNTPVIRTQNPEQVKKPANAMPDKTIPARADQDKTDQLAISNYSLLENLEKNPNAIEATLEIREIVKKLQKLERQKKRIIADEDRLRSQVMNYMQLHALLCFKGSIIATWKTHSRTSFNLTAFKAELPHLYPSYTQDISVRNFRLV